MKSGISVGVMLLALLLAACGPQNEPTPAPPDLDLSVQVEPDPPAVGEAVLIITIKDASGSPVDGATLQVHGDMDHEGMTPVDREVSESAGGEYRVPFEWTMGGGWIVTVTAQLPDGGGTVSETFDFFVEAVSSESIINRSRDQGDATINIAYQPDNDPVTGGDSPVTITLTTESGSPITDALVEVVGDMAHAGMMPISATGEHTGGGQYHVPLRWTMAGDWQVTVTVTLADGSIVEESFDQQVVMPAN